jgi:hypothetical protein
VLTANLDLALQLCAPCRRSSCRIERLELAGTDCDGSQHLIIYRIALEPTFANDRI